jgi:hypothetical protein
MHDQGAHQFGGPFLVLADDECVGFADNAANHYGSMNVCIVDSRP